MITIREAGQEETQQEAEEKHEKALLQQATEDEHLQWLNLPYTQALIRTLENQSIQFMIGASASSYSGQGSKDNQLTKAETLRKVVEYARTKNTSW